MSSPETVSDAAPQAQALLSELDAAREQTLALVDGLDDDRLEQVFSPLMSPLVWDLGHIAAYEDLWLGHRVAGKPLLRADLADRYDAFETPRAARAEIDYLRGDEARAYIASVRERVRSLTLRDGVGDGLLYELVLRHERQHNETMLQTLNLARLEDWAPAQLERERRTRSGPVPSGLELVTVPAGEFILGADGPGFAYDNERPAHVRDLAAFAIGRYPITNGDWLEFVRDGGYDRREWWSAEGWAWCEAEGVSAPLNWIGDAALDGAGGGDGGAGDGGAGDRGAGDRGASDGGAGDGAAHGGWREWRLSGPERLDPAKPIVHVSWYEADAFARSRELRLATEAEWEKAATWDPATASKRRYPWGDEPPSAAHANLIERHLFGTASADAHPAGAAPCGALAMIGDVWEWTASVFDGYEGFVAHPYREYSEVFFGDAHRVLRGGSWATSARVATPTFRNWDYPQRRQIFSGLRVAADL